MPPANRDSSELTRKRRAMALNAYKVQLTASGSIRPEQTAYGTLDVVTARKQGGCYCSAALSGTYDKTGPGCGC